MQKFKRESGTNTSFMSRAKTQTIKCSPSWQKPCKSNGPRRLANMYLATTFGSGPDSFCSDTLYQISWSVPRDGKSNLAVIVSSENTGLRAKHQTYHCVLVFVVGVVALGIISVIGLCVTQVASQQHFLGQFHQFQPGRQTINKTRPGQLLSHSSSLIKLHKC